MTGLIGKKVGMTQIFDPSGNVIPVTVIELGPNQITHLRTEDQHGYSAICLARGLQPDGKLITIEKNDELSEYSHKYFKMAGLESKIELWVGNALEIIPMLDQQFDLIFIDADKDAYSTYLDFALTHTRPGGLIIADNADGHGYVHQELSDVGGRRGIQIYNERVADHPRLVSNIIPVGGWLAVSLVLGENE